MQGILRKLRRLLNFPSQAEAELSGIRSTLADLPGQFEGELAAVKAKLAAVEVKLAALEVDLDAQLACLRQPDDLRAARNLIAIRLHNGKELPDDIHEKALRLQLQARPYDPRLTYSLVALLHRQDRQPIPDAPAAGEGRQKLADDDIDALVNAADACAGADDVFGVYANLWQACVRFPDSARGWAEYARCFAERYEWRNCRLAAARALAVPGVPDAASADALLAALGMLAEHNRVAGLDWDAWFERLPEALRSSGRAARLLVACGRDRAAMLLPQLTGRAGETAEEWLTAAKIAFAQERLSESYDYLRRALELDPAGTLHAAVRDWGVQASIVVDAIGKTDELVDWLSTRHARDPGMNLVPGYPAPEGLLIAQRRRNDALERGLPPALLMTLYKSASATLHNILASGFRLPTVLNSLTHLRVVPPWLADFMRGGASYGTHLVPSPRNIDLLLAGGVRSVIVHVRDPRQVAISPIEHVGLYPRELLPSERKKLSADPREKTEVAIGEYLPAAVDWIKGWMDARSKFTVHFTTFEDFVRDPNGFVDRLVVLYGGDSRYFDRGVALRESPIVEYHRRRGKTDEWRGLLDAKQTEHVNARMPDDFWSTFGWIP